MKKRIWLAIIVAVQAVLLLSIAGKYYYVQATGTPITLRTAPVDPSDLFYGEYVSLRYEIDTLPLSKMGIQLKLEDQGRVVYVLVEPAGKQPWYEARGVYLSPPSLQANQAVLRAHVDYIDEYADTLHLNYGLNRYYLPEGLGKEMEQKEHLLVDLRTRANGEAVIASVHW